MALPALIALTVASGAMQGLAARSSAEGQALDAETNAFQAGTRALQKGSILQRQLQGELGAMRASLGGLNAGNIGLLQTARKESARTRRIETGNERQQALSLSMQAQALRKQGRLGMFSGMLSGVSSALLYGAG